MQTYYHHQHHHRCQKSYRQAQAMLNLFYFFKPPYSLICQPLFDFQIKRKKETDPAEFVCLRGEKIKLKTNHGSLSSHVYTQKRGTGICFIWPFTSICILQSKSLNQAPIIKEIEYKFRAVMYNIHVGLQEDSQEIQKKAKKRLISIVLGPKLKYIVYE